MFKRLLLVVSLTCLAILPLAAEIFPTDAQIDDLWATNPALVREMARKLYNIEHSPLGLTVPPLTIYIATDGSAKITADALLTITLGTAPYTMDYSQALDFTTVKVAIRQDTVPWGAIIVTTGIVGIVGGVLFGAFVLR